jgi:flagellar motor switch protein FliN/FliY
MAERAGGGCMSSPSLNSPKQSERIAAYAGDALCRTLNRLTGTDFQAVMPESPEFEKPEDPIVWRQPFPFGDGAVLWMIVGRDLWETAGRLVLGGISSDSVTDEDCRSTWNEIAGQAAKTVAEALSADLEQEVAIENGDSGESEPDAGAGGAVLEIRNSVQICRIRIAWTPAFAEAFPAKALRSATVLTVPEAASSKTLDLLMDVSLPVSVSFGKTSMQIRDVLNLNTGSVVELDRLVSEPVEVIVNNCIIARGEVVVVDGNYGVRIIQLASRAERLRSGIGDVSFAAGAGTK